MTFAIPGHLKQFNSLVTPTVLDVELNDTDVDRMMTHILELAVKYGRKSSSSTNPREFDTYVEKLMVSGALKDFGDESRPFLEGWLKSSVVRMERGGLKRGYEQMGYLHPLTIAAYRSGLPKSSSRHRRADTLVYRSMVRQLSTRGVSNPAERIQKLHLEAFGQGVSIRTGDWMAPEYDGTAELDIVNLLALRFLEGFEPNRRESRERPDLDPPVPLAVDPIGCDMVDYLQLYGARAPVAEAFSQMSALISLRLFQLPLVTARVVRALLNGEPPPTSNPSEIYCDFVRTRGSASDELSRMCVQRDLEVMRTFFGDRLLLRSLSDATSLLPPGDQDSGQTALEKLATLAEIRDEPLMQMALRMKLQEIETALGDGDEDGRLLISDLRASSISPAEQLKAVLVEGLRKRGLENQVKWFWSTGGLTSGPTTKPYALLAGTLRARSTWRYAPTDECVTAMLCLCFVEGERTSNRLRIQDVLKRLEERFGILIDRPPRDLDSADTRAGASENLTAFTRQLQLLGCFQGLSDDLNAQFVTRPREAIK